MPTSVVDIANRALLQIGARAQISTLTASDGSAAANAVSILWTPTFEALARTAYWNCLRGQAVLSLLAAAQGTPENVNGTTLPLPPSPWLYGYAMPSDSLAIRYIVPTFPAATAGGIPSTTYSNAAPLYGIPGVQQIPFIVAYYPDAQQNPGQWILTNQSQAQAVYTVNQPNPNVWDSLFQQAMVSSLAAYLVPPLALNLPLMQGAIKQANDAIALARIRDGNEGVTIQDHEPDWMRVRNGDTGWAWNQNAFIYGGYYDMTWPG